jgi:hypothetical protein
VCPPPPPFGYGGRGTLPGERGYVVLIQYVRFGEKRRHLRSSLFNLFLVIQAAGQMGVVSVAIDSGAGVPVRLLSAGTELRGATHQATLPFSHTVRK